jgi:hypothetical protein
MLQMLEVHTTQALVLRHVTLVHRPVTLEKKLLLVTLVQPLVEGVA